MATQMLQSSLAQVREKLKDLNLQPEQSIRVIWDDDVNVSESTLLAQIRVDFSEGFWRRFAELRRHLEPNTFSEPERQEFLAMNDVLERQNAARIEALVLLAKKRGLRLRDLMDELHFLPLQVPDHLI